MGREKKAVSPASLQLHPRAPLKLNVNFSALFVFFPPSIFHSPFVLILKKENKKVSIQNRVNEPAALKFAKRKESNGEIK